MALRDRSVFQLRSDQLDQDLALIFTAYRNAGQITVSGHTFTVSDDQLPHVIDHLKNSSPQELSLTYDGCSLVRSKLQLPAFNLEELKDIADFDDTEQFKKCLRTIQACLRTSERGHLRTSERGHLRTPKGGHTQEAYEIGLEGNQLLAFMKTATNRCELKITGGVKIGDVYQFVINNQLLTFESGYLCQDIYWQFDPDEGYYHIMGLTVPSQLTDAFNIWKQNPSQPILKSGFKN